MAGNEGMNYVKMDPVKYSNMRNVPLTISILKCLLKINKRAECSMFGNQSLLFGFLIIIFSKGRPCQVIVNLNNSGGNELSHVDTKTLVVYVT